MNRKYTTEQYLEGVQKIRKYFPDASITTDVIVGFCGETEQEFEQTCQFVQKVGFADVHVFPYSPRQGTVSYNWQDLPAGVKTQRATQLGEIKQQLKRNFEQKFVGTTQSVLVEEQKNGFWQGYTKQYLRVYFQGNVQSGQIVEVKIAEPYLDGVKGEVVL